MRLENCISFARTTKDVFHVVDYSIKYNTTKCFDIDAISNPLDLRDIRVRAQRALAVLNDIDFWEPENLTKHQRKEMDMLRALIANCKEREHLFICDD